MGCKMKFSWKVNALELSRQSGLTEKDLKSDFKSIRDRISEKPFLFTSVYTSESEKPSPI
ncbi:hypothetical protein A0128_04060 [Leptospira tipperaryensis]|uniref:Uncharacterized protein n=2 Tax=Leptospira tipperaryensis TaxID=2564040 RepID=A0A1D7UU64_9LEPT|nr:hypothetical protein A0128_04060 [Leptospira tipperaryensis]